MKVAIITERAEVALGGAERSVQELAEAISCLGAEVKTVAATGTPYTQHTHILFRKEREKRVSYSAFSKALKRYLSENDFDIVHSVLPLDSADVYQPRGGSYPEAVRRNIVSYENKTVRKYKTLTASMNFRRAQLVRAERAVALNQPDTIVATLSNYVARQFKKYYAIADERLVVIHNGISFRQRPTTEQVDKKRSEIMDYFGLKEADESVFFLFAGHNFRLKGLYCLIKAFAVSIQNRPGCQAYLVIAGRGKQGRYRRLAERMCVEGRMFFTGPVADIQELLGVTDVAVLPTFYDPCSRFILEALAECRPVITSGFNGAAELFTDGRHGLVVDEPRDTQALAAAITHFTHSKNIAASSEHIAADDISTKVSIKTAAEKLENLYETILKRRGH